MQQKYLEEPSCRRRRRRYIQVQEFTTSKCWVKSNSIPLVNIAFFNQKYRIVKTLRIKMINLGQEHIRTHKLWKLIIMDITIRMRMDSLFLRNLKVSYQKLKEVISGEMKEKLHTQNRHITRIQGLDNMTSKKRKMTLRIRSSWKKQCMLHSTLQKFDQ